MFAQLFGAAKRAISRTPSYQGAPSEAREEVPPSDTASTDTVTMVTTRRGTETPGMAATPASSAKKTVGKRELEALDTPTRVKRQRKTTVELKRNLRSTPRKGGEASTESTQESVEGTASDEKDVTLKPEKSSPMVVVEDASAQGNAFHTPEPASSEAAFVTPFTSKKTPEGSPTPKAIKAAAPAAAKKARGRPKKAQKDEIVEEIPSSTQESSVASPTVAAANPHVRFGSEEPTMNAKSHTHYEAPALAPAPAPTVAEEDEDSADDSDEAPEMVTTAAATSKAAAAQADTSRALLAQQEKERKKREAREARIAEEQAAKRQRDALKAQKAAAKAAKAARLSSVAEINEQEDATTPMAIGIDRTTLPSLLPDSLLANLGDVRPPTPPPEARGKTDEEARREKLNHHIKFLEQSGKAPKDKRVGKHHIAVLGQQNRVLPPKVSKATRGVREGWLKGRKGQDVRGRPRIGKTARTKFGGGGFLRGED